MIEVDWCRSARGTWPKLDRIALSGVSGDGVFMIWLGEHPLRMLGIGYGDLAQCFARMREDRILMSYARCGALYATWARVPEPEVDGVLAYLGDYWNPLLDSQIPDVAPRSINMPFEAIDATMFAAA